MSIKSKVLKLLNFGFKQVSNLILNKFDIKKIHQYKKQEKTKSVLKQEKMKSVKKQVKTKSVRKQEKKRVLKQIGRDYEFDGLDSVDNIDSVVDFEHLYAND